MKCFRRRGTVSHVQEKLHNNLTFNFKNPTLPNPLSVSHFPDGIKVLHDLPNATFDICFIHGLTGDRERTWTAEGQSTPWPGALLPQKLQQARILTWGYDAYFMSKSEVSSNGLVDHAINLLANLTSDRESCNASSRPLIFVAHSLGGLVCKAAILLSRDNPEKHFQGVFQALKGVVFMGTPHKGAWMADWAKIPVTTFGFGKSTNIKLLNVLKRDNQLLESIQCDFSAMVRQVREKGRALEITCFFEELPTFRGMVVVSRNSASLEGYAPRSIHANHRDMVKFVTVEDNGFKRLLGELRRWTLAVDKKPVPNPGRNHDSSNDEDRACLKDLYTTDPRDDKRRIEKAKGGLLKDSYCWVFENDQFKQWRYEKQTQLLWVKGDPGKGKTMLLCGIINEVDQSTPKDVAVSFFFCQATDTRLNHAAAVLRGLIFNLVDQQPHLISHVRRQYDKSGRKGFEDVNAWEALSKLFIDILENPLLHSIYVIIDALDECTKDLDLLLDLVTQKSSVYPHVKWIVSSRSWPVIGEALEAATQKAILSLELNEKSTTDAVTAFIRHKVQELTEQKKYKAEMRDAVSQHLLSNAQGTFLWVALVCEELAKAARWRNGNACSLLTAFPAGLESLYSQMMEQIRKSEDADLCRRILGVVLLVYRPITLAELPALVELPEYITADDESTTKIVEACGSFLTIRKGIIFFVHQSAKDFLLQTISNEIFTRGKEAEHYAIFYRCLQSLRALRQDMYGLKSTGFPIDQVKPPDPDPLAALRYSCLYWVDHLHDCEHDNANDGFQRDGPVEEFLKQRYLFWLEAISLMRYIPEGIIVMAKLDRFLQKLDKAEELSERVRDACRFIQYNRLAIECSPLQVYFSSLIFSPARSMIKSCYESVKTKWVLKEPVMEDDWGPCLQILEGHSEWIAWSQDGSLFASRSYNNDKTVGIWDLATGRCISTLQAQSISVCSIAWSRDGGQLALGSIDTIVRIWDLAMGRCTSTLEGHGSSICSIAWSQDGSLLASGSKDKTIKIWDLATGRCTWTLKGHGSSVCSIAWPQDGSWLASGSNDKTIRIWELATGRCTSTLRGHSSWVLSLAWSQTRSRLASGSDDMTIKIWDPATGQCISTLEGHNSSVYSIAWSRDEKWLASGSRDGRVMTWDADTGRCMSILEGHSDLVSSISWSQDGSQLASGSHDNTVRIWDPVSQGTLTPQRHNSQVWSVAWSRDGSQLVSVHDGRVMIWDPATGRCISTLEGQEGLISSISCCQDGTQLPPSSFHEDVEIWDLFPTKCASTLDAKPPEVKTPGVKSPDGLCFDKMNVHHLYTDLGVFNLGPSAFVSTSLEHFAPQPEQGVYGLSDDRTWITFGGENLLWIPSEYRVDCFSFFAASATTTVAIGCSTGRVLFLTLPNDSPISYSDTTVTEGSFDAGEMRRSASTLQTMMGCDLI